MSLTVIRLVPAFLLIVTLWVWAGPACAGPHAGSQRPRDTRQSIADRLGLFSLRVRRSTATYLHLRLLELREEQLDRARAAIERRLSVDDLIFNRTEPAAATPVQCKDAP